MRKVTCHECKKRYDYDEEGFCPVCGAFNAPSAASRIDAEGNLIRQEELNSKSSWGTLVQLEQPEEEVDQLWGKLQQSFKANDLWKRQGKSLMPRLSGRQIPKMRIKHVIWFILGLILFVNVLLPVLYTLIYY